MEKVIKDNWQDILQIMNDKGTSLPVINAWIKPLELYKIENNTIYFFVHSDQRAIDFMKKKLLDYELVTAIQDYTNSSDISSIEFLLKDKANEDIIQNTAPVNNSIYMQNLNPKYTFESFVIGDNNKLAQATAIAVAEAPGEIYNPLFIYGGSGLGKTHLIQAIAHYILDSDPNKKVLYVTSEKFTNELIESIKSNTASEFRKKYRELDVLLIDDIQFIVNKDNTQEEFFNTFNALREYNKQIILSSDKPPKDLNGLPDRLINRFESGVLADIGSPNYEIRMAILKKKCETENIHNISNEILDYIANNITSNIRELEGALNRICVYNRITSNSSEPISLSLAEEALKDMIKPDKAHEITPELIIDTVCDYYNITLEQIISSNRSHNIAKPRMICMYLCRDLLSNITLKQIGSYLGNRNHSTIMHGADQIKNEINSDANFRTTIENLTNKITSN
ncbi:MAG: chromosomal replication initiator protein DnaA [Lachnospiraceae bacterium]|nr:chromosomal replication initiator protein DnaA [Lachnospiraceae bacterium]